MAQSPAHRFGQIIGDLLEPALRRPLAAVAERHGLYLDYKHARPVRRLQTTGAPNAGRNTRTIGIPKDLALVKWHDSKGNAHLLDYVFEAGGSEHVQGTPKAFIEMAWRRYTKHSRNKAQEIQGAILPLFETYHRYHPFLGAVLAGVFTAESLAQLRSHNFHVLYYPYESVLRAFEAVGIDAHFDEHTPDATVQAKIDAYEALGEDDKQRIGTTLVGLHLRELDAFLQALETILMRTVEEVYVVPIHGAAHHLTSVDDAIQFLQSYDEGVFAYSFLRYEVVVRYTNGNEILGKFNDKASAIDHLKLFL